MNLILNRIFSNDEETLGILYFNKQYLYTLEDEHRTRKVDGQTRIPAGKYKIAPRYEGGFYDSYLKHKNKQISELTQNFGVPHVLNVPGFKYILIHIGNTESDTNGCILIGNGANNFSTRPGMITESTDAYIRLMSAIGPKLTEGITLTINDIDLDIRKQL